MAGSEASTFNLKHRLVGALVLVLCAVVLLPKLLTGDGQRGETAPNWATEMQIEPQFDQDFVSRIVAAPSAPEPSTASETSTKDVTPPPATANRTGSPAATAPSAAPDETPAGGEWIVRIGTFAKSNNAVRVVQRLTDLGYSPRTDEVELNGRKATRVWVGPYPDQGSASGARLEIEKSLGEKGFVAAYR